MSEVVGKIVPGLMSASIGLYVLLEYRSIMDMSAVLVSGFMFYWGLSTAYYPCLDLIGDAKDYLHKYSAKKLGVEP